jgi:methylamine dehydrogenase accessory protein MauD
LTALTVSSIVLWTLQIATIIVVVGLARQVGLLHLRLPPQGAGRTDDGPQPGEHMDLGPAVSLTGEEKPVLVPGQLSALILASPSCGVCAPTMAAVGRLGEVEPDVRFVVGVDGEASQAIAYAAGYGIKDVFAPSKLGVNITARPFAVIVSDKGTVLAAGVPNTLEQVESLLAAARHANSHATSPDDAGGSREALELDVTQST